MRKDDAAGKIIEEFVGLRVKLYSYKINGSACGAPGFAGKEDSFAVEHKKCKEVIIIIIKNSY